jgi:SAM-dependent methyltransferase
VYARAFGDLTGQAIPQLLDIVQVRAGSDVLDLCCGPGFVATAAHGLGANVLGVDFASAMVDSARSLNPGLEFIEANVQSLPLDDEQFDAAVMNFGLIHLPDPDRAFREACRVLRSGGRFAATAWGAASSNSGFGILNRAIEAHGTIDVHMDVPVGPDYLRFADSQECRRSLAAAGFREAAVADCELIWHLDSADHMIDITRESTVRTALILQGQSPAQLQAIRNAVHEGLLPYRVAGGFDLPLPAIILSAVK